MSLPVISVPALSNEQPSPLAEALSQYQNMVKSMYAAPTANQALLAARLGNQASQAKLPYVGPEAAAELKTEQARPGLMGAQEAELGQEAKWYGPKAQADIGQALATTGLTQAQTKYLPLEDALKAQNANKQGSRFGASYNLLKGVMAMDPATRAIWMSNNQASYDQALADMANATQSSGGIDPNFINKFIPGAMVTGSPVSQGAPPVQTSGNAQVQNTQGGNLGATLGNAIVPRPLFKPQTPDQIAQQQNAGNLYANKVVTTAATRRQNEGGIQVEDMMDSDTVRNQVSNAALYAGAFGKGKAAVDALRQQNPHAYEDYLSFTNHTIPLLANRIKTVDAMGATDKQSKTLDDMFSKTMNALTSNPSQFVTQWNNLRTMIHTVEGAVHKSASPVAPDSRVSGIRLVDQPQASIQIPKFNSKEEGIQWFSSLSPDQKRAVRNKLSQGSS